MRITQSHLDLWEAAQRRPTWAAPIVAKKAQAGRIDDCINAQVPWPRHSTALASLLVLCASYRRRGELRTALRQLVIAPGTLIDPEGRSRWARRFLRRLERA